MGVKQQTEIRCLAVALDILTQLDNAGDSKFFDNEALKALYKKHGVAFKRQIHVSTNSQDGLITALNGLEICGKTVVSAEKVSGGVRVSRNKTKSATLLDDLKLEPIEEPSQNVYYVDVGDLPRKRVEEILNELKNKS